MTIFFEEITKIAQLLGTLTPLLIWVAPEMPLSILNAPVTVKTVLLQ